MHNNHYAIINGRVRMIAAVTTAAFRMIVTARSVWQMHVSRSPLLRDACALLLLPSKLATLARAPATPAPTILALVFCQPNGPPLVHVWLSTLPARKQTVTDDVKSSRK